jgi:WD40 repeat protein
VLDRSEVGGHLVRRYGTETIDGIPFLDPTGRTAVGFGGGALTLYSGGGAAETLDRNSDARAIAFSGDGSTVAVARPAGPVSLYSTVHDTDLPSVAQVDPVGWTATTSFGQVTFAPAPGSVLRGSEESGVTTVLTDAEDRTARVRTASPDGGRAVVELTSDGVIGGESSGEGAPLVLVDADGQQTDVSDHCPGVDARWLAFLPGSRFTDRLEDAEAQLLIDKNDMGEPVDDDAEAATLDCATGRRATPAGPAAVLDYQIDERRGRIVASTGEGIAVTTWLRGQSDTLRTTTLPGVTGDSLVDLDRDGTTAAVWRPGTAQLSILQRTGDIWQSTHAIDSGIEGIVSAEPIESSGLLVVTGASGRVELFDLDSGRLVLRTDSGQSIDSNQGASDSVVDAATVEEDGVLLIRLTLAAEDGTPSGGRVIRVPVAVDQLRDLLCAKAPRADGC